ncbi:MAG: Dipeptide transport system permease protein DppC [Firmicutes bacterium ADurb.Bin248]|nr:MAG: Dipeptide transport system permease protein DppC [Firmicutes bacterium ADurb.Bin248]
MSSKYSLQEKLSRKLQNSVESGVNASFGGKDDLSAEEITVLDPGLFASAGYDEKEAERGGYSNYSYWRSTVRMFMKNRMAVAMLATMLALLVFTFIQPLLPNQFKANTVNYYASDAVWITVDEQAKMTVGGVKLTKGDYPVQPAREELIAYIRVPESWGVPFVSVQAAGQEEADAIPLEPVPDENNEGWFYVVVPKETPCMVVKSANGEKTTFHKAAWITVDEATRGVTSSTVMLTAGPIVADGPEGTVPVYVQTPASWGAPKMTAATILRGDKGVEVQLTPDPANEGWYYAFVPVDKVMLTILSEDGSVKGANKGVVRAADPTEIKPVVGFISNMKPDDIFWFGTNDIGQDLWARMWAGTRTSLLIGIIVAAINAFVGIVIGLLWGYIRKLDFIFTELYNIVNNIPTTIILILASYIMRPSIPTIIVAMCITGWISLARFIRNLVIIIRDRDFNLASRCLGTPTRRIVVKNLLPQMVSVIMLRMALAIPGAIGSEVFLAYIGLGLPIDIPSLGNLVNKGRSLMMAPSLRYQLFIPAIILSVITICFYLVGNAFADAADPKNHV